MPQACRCRRWFPGIRPFPFREAHPNMDSAALHQLCEAFLAGQLNDRRFLESCLRITSQSTGEAEIDLDRAQRCGFPEVIFGQGKSVAALLEIVRLLQNRQQAVLVTRITVEQEHALREAFPSGIIQSQARTFRMHDHLTHTLPSVGRVAVITAGTGDLPIALEAAETLAWMQVEVVLVTDVGVAGPHRLPAQLDRLQELDAAIVVAGMEGALPSVVGGYLACPVIGVPTSVGYGANLGGVAALLSMLNSCAANVTVVNIDAGFKAGYCAGLIARRCSK